MISCNELSTTTECFRILSLEGFIKMKKHLRNKLKVTSLHPNLSNFLIIGVNSSKLMIYGYMSR